MYMYGWHEEGQIKLVSKVTEAYKLLNKRKNGTLGPLFINRRQVIPFNKWLQAEDHPTKGYAHRPGWHAAPKPYAPHLTEKGRVWCRVELTGAELLERPASQGGAWYLARRMRVLEEL
jgi:hypothetical protein